MKFSQFRVLRSRSQRFALIGLTGLLVVALASGLTWLIRSHAAPSTVITSPTTGAITVFPVPTSSGLPTEITAGPDGNLWFIEFESDALKIGRITPKGMITEFPLPPTLVGLNKITTGPDGNLWFTAGVDGFSSDPSDERYHGKIGRITIGK